MEDVRIGTICRAVRRRRGWRQADVAQAARVPQTCVSLLERGHLDRLRVQTIRRVASALEIDIPFEPRWRGGEMARLVDAAHAHLVERCATELRLHGWTIEPEYTFSVYGERGSVDILAWRPQERALLIVEVKSSILDLQALLSTLDRKMRLVPKLLVGQRGWRPLSTGRLLFAPGTTRNRRVVKSHTVVLEAAFPAGGREARTWLRRPIGDLAALWLTRAAIDGPSGRTYSTSRVRLGRVDRRTQSVVS